MKMKPNKIAWKFVDKKDKKQFNKWTKKEKFLLKENFYTDFFNINNGIKLKKNTVEFLAFNKLILNSQYDEIAIPEELRTITGTTLKEFLLDAMIASVNDDAKTLIEKLTKFVFEVVEYKLKKQKDNAVEFDLLMEYGKILNEFKNSKIEFFNKWALFVNKNLYIKQKGYL